MPVMKALSTLDRDMEGVLSRQDLSPDEKVKHYSQVLQRYIQYEDKRKMAEQAPIQMQMTEFPNVSTHSITRLQKIWIPLNKKS